MKKIIMLVLAAALLLAGASALADESVTLEVKTAKLPIYAADDPYLDSLGLAQEGDALPVLVLQVQKSLQVQVTVWPGKLANKRVSLSVDNTDVVRVRGNTLTGQMPGAAVLTIASEYDPSVTVQYRVAVIRPVSRITVTAAGNRVPVGGTLALTADFVPGNATMKEVTWSSANPQIASVDENGNVTGLKRGGTSITAAAKDGSNVRASFNILVAQSAEEIRLDRAEASVDAGRTVMLKATVLPADTNDKGVVWSSSDESVAVVSPAGRITGVALGDCEITCASASNDAVRAKATVHVLQPVTGITFSEPPEVYVGETGTLAWSVEPANASNPAIRLTSGNGKILTVSDDGTITGVKAGYANVKAVSTDGSNKQANVKVRILQHVTGVHMYRHTAYIDRGETATTSAVLEPSDATNHNMTWESADPAVAKVSPVAKQGNRVSVTGVSNGETTVTGTTEDGGFQASINVKIGDFSRMLKILHVSCGAKGKLSIKLKNVSDLPITYVRVDLEAFGADGKPVPINLKDGTNVVQATYHQKVEPGHQTTANQWSAKDLDPNASFSRMTFKVIEYQINNDWIKLLRTNRQLKAEYSN